ncbi:CD74 molecule, major histocompatibility complex, class II invariant chain a [Pungitius pungitius]|uniref:CD74 molecule, major histocompatibility complex, class II invariant chain a n=1 Tax=Pungitius pungitius TaxID=134920 RepID=UPI001888D659|nr:CD74 molecule, major histocompatibility complex, class II invariant chain a [Pungitius pungitius]
MADSAEDAPLSGGSLAGSEQVLVASAGPAGGSNQRAFKVAALTTIACLLLASQVFTAFMVFDQKQEIHTLQKDSTRLGKQLTRVSQAPVRMQMPMRDFPLLKDYTSSKKPLAKLQDTVASLETQVKDLVQDSQLPQFNETFLANLENLKQHINESEWTSFESWMRYWLIFQMAQKKPPTPAPESAAVIQTKCQLEGESGATKIGSFKPQCDEQGRYKPMQCWHATGFCWCVDQTGKAIAGTSIRGHPDCQRGYSSRRMLAPMRIQKTISVDDE